MCSSKPTSQFHANKKIQSSYVFSYGMQINFWPNMAFLPAKCPTMPNNDTAVVRDRN